SGVRKVRPGTGMLDAFARLCESPDKAILDFAKRWGTMHFCKDGLPYFHRLTNDLFPDGPERECHPLKRGRLSVEPVVYWRRLSAVARAILNIAAELNQDRSGEE